jgi:hypothetical protein
LTKEKTIVHGLWVGENKLKNIELLTLKSFVDMGAEFHLWNYGNVNQAIPDGVVLCDAEQILGSDKIFKRPEKMYFEFGGGNYVSFSDVFRYKILYDLGGWWSDLDVVCLKPLEEVESDYWFRFHGVLPAVGNVMKCPQGSELMRLCYEKTLKEVNSEQCDMYYAVFIMCFYIELLGLKQHITYNECNMDNWDTVVSLILEKEKDPPIPDSWRFIHWMNSVTPKRCIGESFMSNTLKKYNLFEKNFL